MKKIMVDLESLKLVGITTRTNNSQNIFVSDPSKNKIAAVVMNYFHNSFAQKIQNRKNPGTTFCVYTDYESDFNGDYTYFIGEEVTSFDGLSEEFCKLTIPSQCYAKFTSEPGPMPNVCIDMWNKIWKMDPSVLGGQRAYIADFEVYDQRASDHNNVILDIFIGVKK